MIIRISTTDIPIIIGAATQRIRTMKSERHIAVRTLDHATTVGALDVGRKTASILEQHRLLAALQNLAHAIQQSLVEMRVTLATFCRAERIRDDDSGHLRTTVSLLFSCLGYENVTYPVGNSTVIDVTMRVPK
mgnify:CR=1 FL=1